MDPSSCSVLASYFHIIVVVTLKLSENLGADNDFPIKKNWREEFLSNEIPISPSSPRSKCKPAPLYSVGAVTVKLAGEVTSFQSGPSKLAIPSSESPTLRLPR